MATPPGFSRTAFPQQPDHSGLQVNYESPPEVYNNHEDNSTEVKYLNLETTTNGSDEDGKIPVEGKKRWQRRYIIIGALLAVVIITGTIVAGVMVSRNRAHSNNKSGSGSNMTVVSTPETTAVPSSFAPGSHLAATAWQGEGGYTKFLIYQAPDNSLQYSMSSGSDSAHQSSWDAPKALGPQYTVANGTTLVPLVLAQEATQTPQLNLFYLNSSSVINGINYTPNGFNTDAVNEKNLQALPGSNLGGIWPFFVFQTISGALEIVAFSGTDWDLLISPYRAMRGSSLALVPIARNETLLTQYGQYAMFYQDEAGKLRAIETPYTIAKNGPRSEDSAVSDSHTGWNISFPDITLPNNASFAAFSVSGTTDNTTDAVLTFLLYQDEQSAIHQIWRYRSPSVTSGLDQWKTSTPRALQGADAGTKLACVTTPEWSDVPRMADLLLEATTELTRCYFQRGGKVMEAQLNGVDWEEAKEVPIS